MTQQIISFIKAIDRTLMPSGHLLLWMDKFHLCTGTADWFDGTDLKTVDLIVWNKMRMGMGYRTRRISEYCLVLQKAPLRAKGDLAGARHSRRLGREAARPGRRMPSR